MSAARASGRPRKAAKPTRAHAITAPQIRWLGALLIAAQLPQAVHLPIWVALIGFTLVLVRLALLERNRVRPHAKPARIPSWALVVFAIAAAGALKVSFGYLLGREPSVAFLYILVGIKFLETRTTRDGALLCCLACFLLMTPFLYSQSLFAAVAALPALLIVGATLDSLNRIPTDSAMHAPWRETVQRSGIMLLQGIPIAVLLFLLFPRLASPLWGLPADYRATTGLSDRMSPGQISDLSLSDTVAFRVDFEGPVPAPSQRYWRGPVLTRFDGRSWTAARAESQGELARYDAPSIAYTVALEPHDKPWLFALDVPAALPRVPRSPIGEPGSEIGTLTRDQRLLARTPVAQPLRYAQISVLRDRYPGRPDLDVSPNTQLPRSNNRTLAFARGLRSTHPSDRAYISAVLRWFNTESFVYTLTPPLAGRDPVDFFLFEERRGFCEHYASAFVVLLRAAGIPARIVTGYQGGEINPRGEYMIVRHSDAHAWAEALLDGEWQRFDPTAAVAPSRIEMGLGGALPTGAPVPFLARLDIGWLKNVRLVWDAVNHDWRRNVIGYNHDRQRSLWRDLDIDPPKLPWIVAVVAAFITLWGTGVLGFMMWTRNRRNDRALVLWNLLTRRLAHAGLPRHCHEGPMAFARRAAQRWPRFGIAFAAIGEAFSALRYGAMATARERDALVATLERAIEVLPPAGALRTTT